jgi:hypothetical protein
MRKGKDRARSDEVLRAREAVMAVVKEAEGGHDLVDRGRPPRSRIQIRGAAASQPAAQDATAGGDFLRREGKRRREIPTGRPGDRQTGRQSGRCLFLHGNSGPRVPCWDYKPPSSRRGFERGLPGERLRGDASQNGLVPARVCADWCDSPKPERTRTRPAEPLEGCWGSAGSRPRLPIR